MDWLTKLSLRQLTWAAVVLAAVIVASLNMLTSQTLRAWRADLTESKLFTISNATRTVLSGLKEPVAVKFYFSRSLGDQAPQYGAHGERVRGLLQLYEDLAGGNLKVEFIDPQPLSDAEDRAVAAGLRGVPLGAGAGTGYLGIVGTNSTDNLQTITFLTIERQEFLEYDLTKLIHQLSDPARKKVGLITTLGIAGGVDPQRGRIPAWMVHRQMSEFFDVEPINPAGSSLPDDIDVLMLAAPGKLSAGLVYAIDQFALAGKPVVAFLDVFPETSPQKLAQLEEGEPIHDLLNAWGVKLTTDKVVGDVRNARRVQFNSGGQPQVAGYVVWLDMGRDSLDADNALFSSIEHLVMASPAAISKIDGAATTFQPLITTSSDAMLIESKEMRIPDPLRLIQNYKPGGEPIVLSARVSGDAKTAFKDGAPPPENKDGDAAKADDAKAQDPKQPAKHLASGAINVVLVGDADMLFDSFWAEAREMLGQRFIVPRANNVDFLLNALENVSGGAVLSDLRGRGVEQRPFTLVQDIRQRAEAQYRQREQALNTKLEETQKKLEEIQSRAQGGKVILSEEDKKSILGFRSEVIAIRKDLREVQKDLRRDIDKLGFWVKAINIAGIPMLIGLAGIGVAMGRRRKRGH
ncbi:MAG: ABC transporter [Rhizobiales bacterium]|nr:ABC transporter [Hyphomicrobiales bacterium]